MRVSPRSVAALAVVWGVVALYVAQVHVPRNVLTLPGQSQVKYTVANFAPQGWAFFTKSPRDPDVLPYGQNPNGTWTSLNLAPHANPHNAFGLDRRSRSQGIEIALLLDRATDKDWKDCEDDLNGCLADARPVRKVANPSPEATLCGTVALVQEKPVPYGWRDLTDDRLMPERFIVLDVSC